MKRKAKNNGQRARKVFSSIERLEDRRLNAGITGVVSGGILRITGTEAADSIVLSHTNNSVSIAGVSGSWADSSFSRIEISGLGGNDSIRVDTEARGQAGITCATTIWGGNGDDTIYGGQGSDFIFGNAGNDVVWSGAGNDVIDGALGNDQLHGGAGADSIFGDWGNDSIWGEDGDDCIVGGNDTDVVFGGNGADRIDGGAGSDTIRGEAGADAIWDDASGNTLYVIASEDTRNNSHFAWFDMTVSDERLRSYGRFRFVDGALDRNEVMGFLRSAGDDGTVSSNELADMRALASSVVTLNGTDAVRVLANKVVNANAGNAKFQGAALGNLAAGDSAAKLNNLVNQWFLGADRPVAKDGTGYTYNYRAAQGSLFVSGASYTDINQGYLGDCYFLAGLGAAAKANANSITQMFTDNGDGTFTVRFFNNGVADYVTVDKYLPTTSDGRLIFAGMGKLASSTANELWVALAEKAYVQMNECGWLRGAGGTNVYASIEGGYIADAFKQITGKASTLGQSLNQTNIVNALNAGQMVGVASKSAPAASNVVGGHAYVLVGFNSATQKFTLFNPWGVNNGTSYSGTLELTYTQLTQNFSYWDKGSV